MKKKIGVVDVADCSCLNIGPTANQSLSLSAPPDVRLPSFGIDPTRAFLIASDEQVPVTVSQSHKVVSEVKPVTRKRIRLSSSPQFSEFKIWRDEWGYSSSISGYSTGSDNQPTTLRPLILPWPSSGKALTSIPQVMIQYIPSLQPQPKNLESSQRRNAAEGSGNNCVVDGYPKVRRAPITEQLHFSLERRFNHLMVDETPSSHDAVQAG